LSFPFPPKPLCLFCLRLTQWVQLLELFYLFVAGNFASLELKGRCCL
jgi:hypothetical protein